MEVTAGRSTVQGALGFPRNPRFLLVDSRGMISDEHNSSEKSGCAMVAHIMSTLLWKSEYLYVFAYVPMIFTVFLDLPRAT